MKLWGLSPPDFPAYMSKEERRKLDYQVRYLNRRSRKIRAWVWMILIIYLAMVFSDSLYLLAALAVVAPVAVMNTRSTIRRNIRAVWLNNRLCPDCGYDLRAIRTDRCPECGSAITLN